MLSISKESLAKLPAVTYPGKYHLVETAADASAAVSYLLKQKYIGFDTETKPSFHKGHAHKVSLLQLATADECFLFRLNKIGITEHIKKILESRDVLKVGLSTKDDFHSLAKLCPDLNPDGFIELQSWVKSYEILDNSLSRIFAIIFGERISKSQRLTNWEAENLTDGQMSYAALDAWACLKIYSHLSIGNFDPSLSEYIAEEIVKESDPTNP